MEKLLKQWSSFSEHEIDSESDTFLLVDNNSRKAKDKRCLLTSNRQDIR